ncbi:MAG: thiamine phosphate synthase [Gallionella sp.]|nr:thiamine phosphate synthase [Gallionella sp.]
MHRNARIKTKGLYAITPDEPDTATLLYKVRLALLGGVGVLQYRNKKSDGAVRLEQAAALRILTREFGVPLIVNDDAALARQVDADGVHIGGGDGTLAEARALLGDAGIIGVSCYNRLPLGLEAEARGADYVAFGAFFPSGVKPDAAVATPGLLRQARQELNVPLIAIGGITRQNGMSLIEAGADALAVISALWSAPDIEVAAQEFSDLFKQGNQA